MFLPSVLRAPALLLWLCCPWFFLFLWAPAVPAGLCSLVLGSAIFCFFPGSLCLLWSRPLPCVSRVLVSAVSGSFLSSSPLLSSSLGSLKSDFFHHSLFGLSLGGVPSRDWQAELLASLGGMAPSPRHVLGRRGPVQAGPLPSCCLCLSASSQVPAKAGEPQSPLTLRAQLGAKSDVC